MQSFCHILRAHSFPFVYFCAALFFTAAEFCEVKSVYPSYGESHCCSPFFCKLIKVKLQMSLETNFPGFHSKRKNESVCFLTFFLWTSSRDSHQLVADRLT